MATEFLFTPSEVAKDLIAMLTVTGNDPDREFSLGSEEISTTLRDTLSHRQKVYARRPKTEKTPQMIVEEFRSQVLVPHSFRDLVVLAASESPLLQELEIEERPLRAALFAGAQDIINGTKLGIASRNLGVDIFMADDVQDLERERAKIETLEGFQARLIATYLT